MTLLMPEISARSNPQTSEPMRLFPMPQPDLSRLVIRAVIVHDRKSSPPLCYNFRLRRNSTCCDRLTGGVRGIRSKTNGCAWAAAGYSAVTRLRRRAGLTENRRRCIVPLVTANRSRWIGFCRIRENGSRPTDSGTLKHWVRFVASIERRAFQNKAAASRNPLPQSLASLNEAGVLPARQLRSGLNRTAINRLQ